LIRVLIEAPDVLTRIGLEALLRGALEIELASSIADTDVVVRTGHQDHVDFDSPPPAVLLADGLPSQDALRSGVRAVIPRDAPPAQIVAAIYAAAAGLVAVPAEDAGLIMPGSAEPIPETLTPREAEVLEMLAEGVSNKIIAYRLNISEHTAKFHVNSILAKLNAGTRTEAVTRGIRMGLIKL
jgi:two-component system nitrate/nitrite response regulator NarL